MFEETGKIINKKELTRDDIIFLLKTEGRDKTGLFEKAASVKKTELTGHTIGFDDRGDSRHYVKRQKRKYFTFLSFPVDP
jgi:hypothetical protein